jgi:hypothetical protein
VAEQSRWIISEIGRFARGARVDPSMNEKGWDDYNVMPNTQLDAGQFVSDGAIWTEKD